MPELRRTVPKRTSAEAELIVVAGHEIAVSNPTKVLFPKPKYTKLDLVRYYLAVAECALWRRWSEPRCASLGSLAGLKRPAREACTSSCASNGAGPSMKSAARRWR